jgi:hypothetical protein
MHVTVTQPAIRVTVVQETAGVRVVVGGGGRQGPPGPVAPKGFGIDWPTSNEDVTMFYTPYALSLADMHVVLRGTGTVDFEVLYGASRDAPDMVIAAATASDVEGGENVDMAVTDVPANVYVWLVTTGVTGEVREFHLTAWF